MKNNKGFSLVELIVVIAIMAILAAVAVIGVSVYIPKAQQASDKQLVSDIEYALHLAMQTSELADEPIGKLVLSQDGVKYYGVDGQEKPLAGTKVEEILINAFGTDYQKALKLKYDGWTASSSLLNGMISDEANLVKDSSFISGDRADQLLTDVEKFTEMAANLAGAMGTAMGDDDTLITLFGPDLLNETAEKYNITVDDKYLESDGTINWTLYSSECSDEFSNLLVLAAAVDTQNIKTSTDETPYTPSNATGLIQSFSTYYAFAATCPEFSVELDKFMNAMNADTETTITTSKGNTYVLQPVDSASDGNIWYQNLNNELAEDYKNADGLTYAQYTTVKDANDKVAADYDKDAFSVILSSLGNVEAGDISVDLSNPNLFTQGAVKDKYDEYLDAVDMMYGYSGDFSVVNGEVAILYNQNLYTVINSIGQ